MKLSEHLWHYGILAGASVMMGYERLRYGVSFDPRGGANQEDPYPRYRRLREIDPFHRSPLVPGYVLTRYQDIVDALADARLSSDERHWKRYPMIAARRRNMGLPEPYTDGGTGMLRIDPPDHTRLRSLVSRAFTPRAIERMRPRVEELAHHWLDRAAAKGEIELVSDFAAPLPVTIIAEMLGVPTEDHERFRHWSDEGVRVLGFGNGDDVRRSLIAQAELRTYLEEIVEKRRLDPRDDLLSGMIVAGEDGDRLTPGELFAQTMLILVAGNETTTNLISTGVVALLRNPEQLERLRADPDLIPSAVNEFLRYDSPVQLTSRMAPTDLEFKGNHVSKGDQLILLLAAGNRDPAAFTDPESLDVGREEERPLSFSHGIHYCLGAQLARLEGEIAFRALLEAFSEIELATDRVEWGENTVLRGPKRLPLRVQRRSARRVSAA